MKSTGLLDFNGVSYFMKIIYTSKNEQILVDDEDYEYLMTFNKWFVHGKGIYKYPCVNQRQPDGSIKQIIMHRLLLGLGKFDGRLVDHEDGNRLNNQRKNIRICSNQQNQRNQQSTKNNKSCKYKGVVKISDKRNLIRYVARVTINKKIFKTKTVKTEIEAALAYNKLAVKYFGEFAYLNIIKP